MNVAISRRIGRVMSVMLPALTIAQRVAIMNAAEKAKSFQDLPKWVQDRVRAAENALPNVTLENFQGGSPST